MAARIAAALHEEGRTVVLTNGCFDLLHVGHLRYLQAARTLGDALFVGINGDEAVCLLKGPARPYVPATDRAELLAGFVPVDYAFVFPERTADLNLAQIRPDVYVKGGDYDRDNLPEAEAAAGCGARLVFIPLVPGLSTTDLAVKVARNTRGGGGNSIDG